jgi:hypothetical protein
MTFDVKLPNVNFTDKSMIQIACPINILLTGFIPLHLVQERSKPIVNEKFRTYLSQLSAS